MQEEQRKYNLENFDLIMESRLEHLGKMREFGATHEEIYPIIAKWVVSDLKDRGHKEYVLDYGQITITYLSLPDKKDYAAKLINDFVAEYPALTPRSWYSQFIDSLIDQNIHISKTESTPSEPPSPLPDAIAGTHVYIAGQSGYGKTTLMSAMALQDILKGHGITILDPKSGFVQHIVEYIPERLIKKTIYLSAETAFPIDFLSWKTPEERSLIAQDVFGLFRNLVNDLGERMEAVIKWTIQALLHAGGCCFFDIYTFLSNQAGRTKILDRVKDPLVLQFWHTDFKHPYYKGAEMPILNRMTDFLFLPALQKVLGSPKPTLTMQKIIDDDQIFLVDLLSFGGDGMRILGCLLTSQIQQVIFRRTPEDPKNRPYYLYADEFQDFKNFSFNEMLRKSRGFKLGLVLANQHPKQIPDVFDDVIGCVSSYMLFRLDATHGRMLAGKIRPHKPEELENLGKFVALYHPPTSAAEFVETPKPLSPPTASYAQLIKDRTKADYPCNSVSDGYSSGDVTAVPLYSSPKEKPQAKPDPEGRVPPDKDKK